MHVTMHVKLSLGADFLEYRVDSMPNLHPLLMQQTQMRKSQQNALTDCLSRARRQLECRLGERLICSCQRATGN